MKMARLSHCSISSSSSSVVTLSTERDTHNTDDLNLIKEAKNIWWLWHFHWKVSQMTVNIILCCIFKNEQKCQGRSPLFVQMFTTGWRYYTSTPPYCYATVPPPNSTEFTVDLTTWVCALSAYWGINKPGLFWQILHLWYESQFLCKSLDFNFRDDDVILLGSVPNKLTSGVKDLHLCSATMLHS